MIDLCTAMLIHNKDDIQFVTEFPCFLVHPVVFISEIVNTLNIDHKTLKKMRSLILCSLLLAVLPQAITARYIVRIYKSSNLTS